MIYFLAHWDWILERSRADIVTNIKDEFQITSICPLEENNEKIQKTYSDSINWDISREKTLDLLGLINLKKILKNINSNDILHIFTLKSLFLYILATLFAQKQYKVVASITGLGFLFAGTKLANFLKIIIKPIIKLRINKVVDVLIFQNNSNMEQFLTYSNFKNKTTLLEGSGLNTKKIKIKHELNNPVKIIFVGRLLVEKGIKEYLKLVEIFSGKEKTKFFIAGKPDFGNKSSVSEKKFLEIKNNPNINYLGEIDVYSELYKYDILIQPSYHEGFSRIFLEGIYSGLLCIVNDLPGTISIAEKTRSGILISNNNVIEYATEIENYYSNYLNQNFEYARDIIDKLYSVNAISEKLKEIYYELS